MTGTLRLIVGLGNPGAEYRETRHNAGFWLVDELAHRHGIALRPEARFQGETARLLLAGEDLRLLKPTTYMNRSGQAVGGLAAFYRIAPSDILVVHDDIDLSPGTVRLKIGGGHGGHNGLRDIMSVLGSRDFLRLRLGIGHPGVSDDVVDYVLRRPPAEERRCIEEALDRAVEQLPSILRGELQLAMNRLHAPR